MTIVSKQHDRFVSKQRFEAESRVCATLRFIGTRVQGGPCPGHGPGPGAERHDVRSYAPARRVSLMAIVSKQHDRFVSKQRIEAESRVCATLRFIGTRVQGRPCQGAHQGAHLLEVSTLEKSRVLFEGAHGVQGAHLDLSTLEKSVAAFAAARIGKLR
jgi:hypothetical protein